MSVAFYYQACQGLPLTGDTEERICMEELSLEIPAWSIECGEHRPDRVLDIRQPEFFHRGHLPGAVNVPYERFQLDALALLQDCGWALIVDSAGARAAEMAIWLRSRGQSAASLEGGMAGWRGRIEQTPKP